MANTSSLQQYAEAETQTAPRIGSMAKGPQAPHMLPYRELFQNILAEHRTIIAASSAAIVGVTSGFPFDSVKTRMQTHNYSSIVDCVKHTYAEEGLRGFFRGMVPPLVTVSVIKSVSFATYVRSKEYISQCYPALSGASLPSLMALTAISGSISGAVIGTLSCPFELVKIQQQLQQLMSTSSVATGGTIMVRRSDNGGFRRIKSKQGNCTPTSSWQTVKSIVREKGGLGLFYGYRLHLGRDVLGTASYFSSYETVKRLLSSPGNPPGPMTHFLAGGICGIFCWLVTFPVDLVKSVMQKEVLAPTRTYASVRDCVKEIYTRQGLRGFYRGINVTLIRAFPIHSLNFLVYEHVLKMIGDYTRDAY
ncbi:hypothetical protein BZG36_01061 [Bifiguratus adelaidae]|uniref:Mitochondrial carrier n=1 Tax=Bifiguratus adelaidae TaxID=1938954 RepID=A0A261Y6E8_9FUNG|nr:hypothetical protein BZG36_01061 [Bifiguratus adelaidae]